MVCIKQLVPIKYWKFFTYIYQESYIWEIFHKIRKLFIQILFLNI